MEQISKIKENISDVHTNLSIYTNKAQQNLIDLRRRVALSSGQIPPTTHSNAELTADELHFLPRSGQTSVQLYICISVKETPAIKDKIGSEEI